MKHPSYILGLDPTPSAPAAVILDETAQVVAAVNVPSSSGFEAAMRSAVTAALDQARIWPDQLSRCYSVAVTGGRSAIAERYIARNRCLMRGVFEPEEGAEAQLILDLQPGKALLLSPDADGGVIAKRCTNPAAMVQKIRGAQLVLSGDPALHGAAADLFTTAGARPPRSASRHAAALGAALFALEDHHLQCGLGHLARRIC